ncbi:MAG: MBL fold metallo-hydrolase [Euryarchaeota archaeon]|nr:MBL fold metallo-hydrolase [Euryarchaeota archaeon]|tara:strand:- start:26 stop:832 length:807 start_codon:yes stop_codon:yes gene_type:complete
MTLSITHLGSGSSGNATLLSTDETKILIDCGFSGRQIEKRLSLLEISPEDIDAILISHHHIDHSRGAMITQKRWGTKIQSNFETCARLGMDPVNECRIFEPLNRIEFGSDLSILPISVNHDGADNVGFIASHGGERAAIVTDLGSWNDELVRHMSECVHISLEANYDTKKLWNGPYPDNLKQRISGRGGHLSNRQTAELLANVTNKKTRSIVLCHLSEQNNAPHIAESEVLLEIDEVFDGDISISKKDGPEFSHYLGQSEPEKLVKIN